MIHLHAEQGTLEVMRTGYAIVTGVGRLQENAKTIARRLRNAIR